MSFLVLKLQLKVLGDEKIKLNFRLVKLERGNLSDS